jgi:hypothetical protein
MNLLSQAKQSFNTEFEKIAHANIIRKLAKQGISHHDLLASEFNELLEDEIKILERDSKRVGVGIGIGLILSLMTGGI